MQYSPNSMKIFWYFCIISACLKKQLLILFLWFKLCFWNIKLPKWIIVEWLICCKCFVDKHIYYLNFQFVFLIWDNHFITESKAFCVGVQILNIVSVVFSKWKCPEWGHLEVLVVKTVTYFKWMRQIICSMSCKLKSVPGTGRSCKWVMSWGKDELQQTIK